MIDSHGEYTLEEIKSLIENDVPESLRLEYKGYKFSDGRIADKDKFEIIKDIVALANADGGNIILGIAEGSLNKPATIQDIGCDLSQFDKLQLSLQQSMLAKVRPRLYGIRYTPIPIEEGKLIAVVFVPKSFNKPHAVNDGNKDEFFIRHSNGVVHMSVDDLRMQVLSSYSLTDRVREFINNRISRILSNDIVDGISNRAILVVHIVPLWSLEIGNLADIDRISKSQLEYLKPMFNASYSYRFNTDGFCTFSMERNGDKRICSFTQAFRNGSIEAIDTRLVNHEGKSIYQWERTESALYDAIISYTSILESQGIPKPWYIFVHLLNALGYRGSGFLFSEFPIDSNKVSGECVVQEDGTI